MAIPFSRLRGQFGEYGGSRKLPDTRRPRARLSLGLYLLLITWAAHPGWAAGFTGTYAPEMFGLENVNADGFLTLAAGGSAISLTGGNTGSGGEGLTDLTILAPAAGIVDFDYSYSLWDYPGADLAGYLLDGGFVLLGEAGGESGSIRFTVAENQRFGWRIRTEDNTGEPGILTITNFSGPNVPEPAGLTLILIGVLLMLARGRIIPLFMRTGESR